MLQGIIEEQEFIDTVDRVIKQVGNNHKFGIYTSEDIAQEIYVECLKKLGRWDKKRSLFNFLLVTAKNHLINMKRDEWYRPECPCSLCNMKDNGKTGHDDGKYCEKFLDWKKRNLRKANIAAPPSIPESYSGLAHEDVNLDRMSNGELQDFIDERLPIKLRDVYLRIKHGDKVSHIDKQKVLKFIKKITKDY